MLNSQSRVDRRARVSMILRSAATLVPAAALVGAGCSSPTSGPASQPPPPSAVTAAASHSPADPFQKLAKGLTAAQIKALLGEPHEIKPFAAKGLISEIWIYQRSRPGKSRQVVARMQEIPYVDPLTGNMRTIQEPVYEHESTTINETFELLMFSGSLASWKQHQETDRSFN